MLISTEVEIMLNVENVDRFEGLGYEIPRYFNTDKRKLVVKRGTKIKVKVEDLALTSHAIVDVRCMYCLKILKIEYIYYSRCFNDKSIIKKYCCRDCQQYKKQEIIEYKQSHGLIKKGDKSFWTFKENRQLELDKYIKKHGTIVGMQKDKLGCVISSAINQYDKNSVEECSVELGYKLEDIKLRHKPENYYDDIENLKLEIEVLCKVLGRFPKQIEVLKTLHINNNYLLNQGGIREIKKMMGYCNSDDLIDDRGYSNLSVYEYMVAQYLIANNIHYRREQYPFDGKHSRLRSDFTLYKENDEQIHIEVWGFPSKNTVHKRERVYNSNKKNKEMLYNQYNYTLIGLNYELFQGKYDDIQKRLFNIFKPHLEIKYKFVEQTLLIPPTKMTDEDMLIEIMKYSGENKMLFPKSKVLQENGVSGLYLEAVKRYGTYFNFAQKFGMYTHYKINKWDSNKIFNTFIYMIEQYGRILKRDEINLNKNDHKLTGIITGSNQLFGGLVEARISFYEQCVISNIPIYELDIKYLDDLIHSRKGFNFKVSTPERIKRAKKILNRVI